MKNILSAIKKSLIHNRKKRIVFPESLDNRILIAANRLAKEELIIPVFIGDRQRITHLATSLNLNLVNYDIINPVQYNKMNELINAFVERRNNKVSKIEAEKLLMEENYFGTMLVQLGLADGLVIGASHTTSEAVRPALQIIKTKQGVRKTSGACIMIRGEKKYVFADCAINIAPTSEDLAEIAIESTKTARLFHMDPRVAILSFSTKGSASSIETERVIEAVHLVKRRDASIIIDGEIQFDAAFVPSLAKKKAPYSPIQGDANVFVFPSLEAGNIGYKITEQMGEFESVGPILQGLNKPVNLLSRGCSEEDVYNIALITAVQV